MIKSFLNGAKFFVAYSDEAIEFFGFLLSAILLTAITFCTAAGLIFLLYTGLLWLFH